MDDLRQELSKLKSTHELALSSQFEDLAGLQTESELKDDAISQLRKQIITSEKQVRVSR